jgi:hypothetical protein
VLRHRAGHSFRPQMHGHMSFPRERAAARAIP